MKTNKKLCNIKKQIPKSTISLPPNCSKCNGETEYLSNNILKCLNCGLTFPQPR